jgi:hypothetical protein
MKASRSLWADEDTATKTVRRTAFATEVRTIVSRDVRRRFTARE